jgi:acetyltransferase
MMDSLSQHIALPDGRFIAIRAVRTADEAGLKYMFEHCSPDDLHMRTFGAVKDFSGPAAYRLTHVDPKTEIALLALSEQEALPADIYGAAHITADLEDPETAEFDVIVRSDLKGHGVGFALMEAILTVARSFGLATVKGFVLRENSAMLVMAHELGFSAESSDGETICVSKRLRDSSMPEDKSTSHGAS